jgi:hypothetical protein
MGSAQVQKIVGDSIPLVSRKIDLPELQVTVIRKYDDSIRIF